MYCECALLHRHELENSIHADKQKHAPELQIGRFLESTSLGRNRVILIVGGSVECPWIASTLLSSLHRCISGGPYGRLGATPGQTHQNVHDAESWVESQNAQSGLTGI